MAGSRLLMVAGLGNPGRQYAETRHNAGFHVVDALSREFGIPTDKTKFDAEFGRGRHMGCNLILVKPQSFMNRSGIPVRRISQFFDVEISDIVVVYDDIDLPFGRIRIRQKGGHGGHNGIRSLIEQLGTKDFPRVRVGIGRPEGEHDVTGHVLGRFSKDEKDAWVRIVEKVKDAVQCIAEEGVLAAMNTFHS